MRPACFIIKDGRKLVAWNHLENFYTSKSMDVVLFEAIQVKLMMSQYHNIRPTNSICVSSVGIASTLISHNPYNRWILLPRSLSRFQRNKREASVILQSSWNKYFWILYPCSDCNHLADSWSIKGFFRRWWYRLGKITNLHKLKIDIEAYKSLEL